ncbi:MAG: c-type cytochrome [Balneolales bacterium]
MKSLITVSFLILLFGTVACGAGESGNEHTSADRQNDSGDAALTAFELDHGLGPITENVEIGDDIDQAKAKNGFEIFDMKCAACHRMDSRLVGPPLGDVTEKRSPEYIMNFILNPEENTKKHPVGQELLKEYMMQMTFQNVSEPEARQILEYFRHVNQTGEEVL